MKSRTRSRKPASIGSNHSSRRPTAISASEPRTGNFVLLLVMAWSPPAHNAGIVWVSAPGDYATFNSNHTPDGTRLPLVGDFGIEGVRIMPEYRLALAVLRTRSYLFHQNPRPPRNKSYFDRQELRIARYKYY